MKIQKILMLLLFFSVLTCIIAPVNAKLNTDVEIVSLKNVKGNTELSLSVHSDIGMKSKQWYAAQSVSKRKKEINQVNKVIVSIKGNKKLTFIKPVKGWKMYKFDDSFNTLFSVKGKVEKKDCSISLYDKKNKIILNKKTKIRFSYTVGSMSEAQIKKNPSKYFNELKSKNKKDKYYSFKDYKYSGSSTLQSNYKYENISNTSSNIDYYYNRESIFKNSENGYKVYSSSIGFKTKKMEKSQEYGNKNYIVRIQTVKGSNGIFKWVYLYKYDYGKINYSLKNPYFNISKNCNWSHPAIINLANTIKASVSPNANKDVYRMEIANAVLRYMHTNIKYDDSFSEDQSAITTLQRKSGTCLGNTMLAGALLRALGIPTYFQTSYNVTPIPKNHNRTTMGFVSHVWVVSYLFYEGKYQWVPGEATTYSSVDRPDRLFNKNSLNWWIIDEGGKYHFRKTYGYYYD